MFYVFLLCLRWVDNDKKSATLHVNHCLIPNCHFFFHFTLAFFLQQHSFFLFFLFIYFFFTTEYLQYGTYATRYYYYIRYYYNLARGTNVNNAYKIYETF